LRSYHEYPEIPELKTNILSGLTVALALVSEAIASALGDPLYYPADNSLV